MGREWEKFELNLTNKQNSGLFFKILIRRFEGRNNFISMA
jgi:hypothetical protein